MKRNNISSVLHKLANRLSPIEAYGQSIEELANHLNYDGLYTGSPTFSFDPQGRLQEIAARKLKNKAYAERLNAALSDEEYVLLANKLARKAIARLKATAPKGVSTDLSEFRLGLTARGGLSAEPQYK